MIRATLAARLIQLSHRPIAKAHGKICSLVAFLRAECGDIEYYKAAAIFLTFAICYAFILSAAASEPRLQWQSGPPAPPGLGVTQQVPIVIVPTGRVGAIRQERPIASGAARVAAQVE